MTPRWEETLERVQRHLKATRFKREQSTKSASSAQGETMINLPTKAQTFTGSSEGAKAPLPAGTYQARLAYIFLDQSTYYGTDYPYQEVQLKWEIYPGETELDQATIDSLNESNLYPFFDRFNELDLKPESYDEAKKQTYKPSVLVGKFDALLANYGAKFTGDSVVEWIYDEDKIDSLGEFPVYQKLSKAEADAYKAANGGKQPSGKDEFKATANKQTMYKGVIKDMVIDGHSIAGQWVSITLSVNAKGYNKLGSRDIKALSTMERKGLKADGFNVPLIGTGGRQAPAGAPT